MRLINNVKFIGETDANPSSKNGPDVGKHGGSGPNRPSASNLLSGHRVPVNCQTIGQDPPNELFPRGRDLLHEYQKLMQGHPNLTDFSTHPSDHLSLKWSNSGEEAGDFSLGLHVVLGQLNFAYESPITAFASTDHVALGKTGCARDAGLGFMASGHADGAIVLYKVFPRNSSSIRPLPEETKVAPPEDKSGLQIEQLSITEPSDQLQIECISIALGDSGRIKVLKFIEDENSRWVVFSVTDTGEVSKWDIRDGRCLATFQPHASMDARQIDAVCTVGERDDFLLCSGSGVLLLLATSDLKLASNLSAEMLYTGALPMPACGSSNQIPILFMGPSPGDLTLGSLALTNGAGLTLLCMLSLGIEATHWQLNPHGLAEQQVLVVSPSAFMLVQIEQAQTMRQLTQSIPPPDADATWDGGFFMPDNQLVVMTRGGGAYHYCWDAAGGLMRVGERSPSDAPQLVAKHFTSLLLCANRPYLLNVLPGSAQLLGTRICLPAVPPTNTLGRGWQHPLPKPGEVSGGLVTALAPISLATEPGQEPRPWVAKGFRDGTVRVVPLEQLLDGSESDTAHLLTSQGHAITCLHQPSGIGAKQLLVSGDVSGGIRLWELSSWVCLASFQGHGQPVCAFFQLPALPPEQQLVFGVAQDASISVLCLKRMVCLGLIPGHRAPVSQVLYFPESVLEVVYGDDHRTHWLLQPGGVRVWTEKVASPRVCGVQLSRMRLPSLRADIACYPVWDMRHPFPVLQVFDINVRSLLRSMNSAIAPTVRLLSQARNLPTQGGPDRRPSLIPEDSHASSDSSLKLSKVVFYALLTKDADVSEILCGNIDATARQLLIGVKGAGSKISFMLHGPNPPAKGSADVWKVSPHATASRLLPSIVMAKAAHSHEGNEAKAIAVLTNYGCLLPELVGEAFQFPCLGYLARFWQDSSADVQGAARSLFLSLFCQVGFTRQRQIIHHWLALLPHTVPVDLIRIRGAGLAVVVLGIIFAHHPNLIPDTAVRARIARSLEWFVSDHARNNFRMSAIQIVSTGFRHFEAHVDGVWVLRSLYSAHQEQHRSIQLVSQQAVLKMTLANTPLFITSLGLAKGASQLSAIMHLVSFLVQSSQALLLPYIARVVEVIVRSLDPRDADQRQLLISPATQCLHDLVAAYPMVDFHPGSQRLAVGVLEGAAVVYDLYTSTRCLVVEGYHSPVSAVAFSPDGKFLATFSAQESVLKIWNSAAGLFDMLAKTLRGHSPAPVSSSRAKSPMTVNSLFLNQLSKANPAPVSAPVSGRTSPKNLAPPQEYSGSISGGSSPLSFFSSSPAPYRTFNTSLGGVHAGSPDSHLIDLRFSGDRSLLLMANGISLVFNI